MPVSLGSSLLLVFALGGIRCGLSYQGVERVFRAVELSPLPGVPPGVRGLINIHGSIVVVFDLGRRLGLVPEEVRPEDVLVLVQTPRRRCALLVNSVEGLVPAEGEPLPLVPHLAGVGKTADGLVIVYDLDRLLSLEEDETLTAALRAR